MSDAGHKNEQPQLPPPQGDDWKSPVSQELNKQEKENIAEERNKTAQKKYTGAEIKEAISAQKDGRVFRRSHSDAILRIGLATCATVMIIQTIAMILLAGNYIKISHTIDNRPVYFVDEESVTYRLKKADPAKKTKYMRDQMDEFVNLVLPALYTHTPEGQPNIELLENLVDPKIITEEKKRYEQRASQILNKRELRSVIITHVEIVDRQEERRYAIIEATGALIFNSYESSLSVPLTWSLIIELQPEIISGPNVYGMVVREITAKNAKQ